MTIFNRQRIVRDGKNVSVRNASRAGLPDLELVVDERTQLAPEL
jgi:hypothetical protein